jgi:hypothetical protein
MWSHEAQLAGAQASADARRGKSTAQIQAHKQGTKAVADALQNPDQIAADAQGNASPAADQDQKAADNLKQGAPAEKSHTPSIHSGAAGRHGSGGSGSRSGGGGGGRGGGGNGYHPGHAKVIKNHLNKYGQH